MIGQISYLILMENFNAPMGREVFEVPISRVKEA